MERPVSRVGSKLLFAAVSALFVLLTVWLYDKEATWVKVMELEAVPDRGRFQVELLADGKNVVAACTDREVSLFVERKLVEGKIHLLIHGQCSEPGRENPVSLQIVSDSSDADADWKYQILVGESGKTPHLTVKRNRGRDMYALSAVLITLFLAVRLFSVRKDKDCEGAEACSRQVMAAVVREPGMERAWAEGRKLFGIMERKHLLNVLFTGWLWLFTAFWMIHSVYHGADAAGQLIPGACILGVLGVLTVGAEAAGRVSVRKILTEHCRPVTSAAACLMMAKLGTGSRRDRVIWYHNGAAGLFRGGYDEEALAVLEMTGPVPGKKDRDFMDYIHTSLTYRCLTELGRSHEARKAERELELILDRNKMLKSRPEIQRDISVRQIRQKIERGEMEPAEADAQRLLDQCQKAYDRLPVLGLLASVKENLGKEAEARVLRSEILTFSPENREVRQAMAEGRLNFLREELNTRDNPGTGFRIACVMGICVMFFLLTMPSLWKVPESSGIVEQETGVAVNPAGDH